MSMIQNIYHALDILKNDGMSGVVRVAKRRMIRALGGGLWDGYKNEALLLAKYYSFSSSEIENSRKIHQSFPDNMRIRKVTWFIPDFFHPYYGGIYTILRFADFLKIKHDVENEFALVGSMDEGHVASLIAQGFPSLKDDVSIRRIRTNDDLASLSTSDASIATLWTTAYYLLRFNQTKRKFYFIQDFEPLFYPAGTIQAQVEATYRFGFYGLANTPTLKDIYETQYGGKAEFLLPCVDIERFFPSGNHTRYSGPYKVFFYGRPDHPRNGFEMGIEALRILKKKMGSDVEIMSAGADWNPSDFSLKGAIKNLGVLNLEETANLYRQCDAGLVLMFTRHPSYLPFELMACGCLVITNFNRATTWYLRDKENCLLADASTERIADTIEFGLKNHAMREILIQNSLKEIQEKYSDWSSQLGKLFDFMEAPKS